MLPVVHKFFKRLLTVDFSYEFLRNFHHFDNFFDAGNLSNDGFLDNFLNGDFNMLFNNLLLDNIGRNLNDLLHNLLDHHGLFNFDHFFDVDDNCLYDIVRHPHFFDDVFILLWVIFNNLLLDDDFLDNWFRMNWLLDLDPLLLEVSRRLKINIGHVGLVSTGVNVNAHSLHQFVTNLVLLTLHTLTKALSVEFFFNYSLSNLLVNDKILHLSLRRAINFVLLTN